MKAEIIAIGTEILLGHIVNTNAAYLSSRLAELGIDVYHHVAVGDNPSRLGRAISDALARSDMVITSGGLGPTIDDITARTAAELLGKKLTFNRAIAEEIKKYFGRRKIVMPKNNIRQAYIPDGAKWLKNTVGTAPGIVAGSGARLIICLPGPPRELVPMFERYVIPVLKKAHAAGKGSVIRSGSVKMTGITESKVNSIVKDLLKRKPPTTVGIYAKPGEVELRIMSKAGSVKKAQKAIAGIERVIRSRLKDYIFGCGGERLEDAVARALIAKRLTISVAESCTGGLVTHRLTNVSGSSGCLKASVVAYSNASKAYILGVSVRTLEDLGAVSDRAALEMASGIRALCGSDIGLGITGIAGPSGGTPKKPVGLVYISLAMNRKKIVKEFRFIGSREEIKFQASQAALNLVRLHV